MTLESRLIDRRTFLGGVGFAAGAVVATTLVPLSIVHAVVPADVPAAEGTWNIDDVCGHWPPYAHPIGFGHVEVATLTASHTSAIDHVLMV
jgi:hypothetical protein